jgi:hypothetical protein
MSGDSGEQIESQRNLLADQKSRAMFKAYKCATQQTMNRNSEVGDIKTSVFPPFLRGKSLL